MKKQWAAPPILSNSIRGKGVAYQPVSGLDKKTWIPACPVSKQLSHVTCLVQLLACLSYLNLLADEDPCLTNGQVSFKSYLPRKITFPGLLDKTFLCSDCSNFQHNKPVYPLQLYLSIPYLHCCSIRIDLLCQDGG